MYLSSNFNVSTVYELVKFDYKLSPMWSVIILKHDKRHAYLIKIPNLAIPSFYTRVYCLLGGTKQCYEIYSIKVFSW